MDQQLMISRRDAKVGPSINCRTQKEGDAAGAKATDVMITDIALSAEELCAFLKEPLAHRSLFVTRAGTKLADPLFKGLAPLHVLGKIDHATVTVYAGLQGEEIKLGICKLARIHLEPKTGGLTLLSCQVQAVPTLDKRIATLLDAMSAAVQVEIAYEHNAEQPDLSLGPGDEEDDEDDDTPPKARRGRRGKTGDRVPAH